MTRREITERKLNREAAARNEKNPVGTMVRYWRGLKQGEPSGTGAVRHEATVVSDHVSAWIEGCVGSVSISHVEAVR